MRNHRNADFYIDNLGHPVLNIILVGDCTPTTPKVELVRKSTVAENFTGSCTDKQLHKSELREGEREKFMFS